jgi:hypothetical protein
MLLVIKTNVWYLLAKIWYLYPRVKVCLFVATHGRSPAPRFLGPALPKASANFHFANCKVSATFHFAKSFFFSSTFYSAKNSHENKLIDASKDTSGRSTNEAKDRSKNGYTEIIVDTIYILY